jgi:hypothetical protein
MFEEEMILRTDPLTRTDRLHAELGRVHLELLRALAELDRTAAWREQGARDTAHLVAMRYGISEWKARRWLGAAHVLAELPELSAALSSGVLGIDKVVELCRFATPATERRLVTWAQRVSVGAIRHRGDLEARASRDELVEVQRDRSVRWWWFDDGRRFGLEAELPAAEGAVVAAAIERLARRVPAMPGEEDAVWADARRADALVALCASDGRTDGARATVVVHARLEERGLEGCEVEDGPVVPRETVERLLCDARVRTIVEDRRGDVVHLGRSHREPPVWMARQVRYRDRECRFPGCGARRFTEAHHIRWWRHGGRTDLGNLVLICSFHHRLVHEHGWSLRREADGEVSWFHPDGSKYEARGPGQRILESGPYRKQVTTWSFTMPTACMKA